jgi:acyl dehydratase
VFANQELIRTGHATAVLYQPNDRYINLMRRTEAAARSKRLGLWGRCGGNPPNRPRGSTGGQDGRIQPSGPGQAAPSGRNTCPASHPVKGNVGQNGKIYHVPGSRDYRRTNPELCFADEAAARAAGHPDLPAVPTFAVVLSLRAGQVVYGDPHLGLDYSRVVHGEQEFVYHRPIRAGDRLLASGKVAAAAAKGRHELLTITTRITTEAGEPVCQATSLLISRGTAR